MPDLPSYTLILSNAPEILKDTEAGRNLLPNVPRSRNSINVDQRNTPMISETCRRVREMCRNRVKIPHIPSSKKANPSEVGDTNNSNVACYHTDEIKVPGSTSDMKPITDPTTNLIQTTSTSNDEEQSLKKLKVDTTAATFLPNILVEVDSLKQVRKRTFSHWVHQSSPSSSQMIEAGFFNCNVGDRVICIYCNIICQQWTPNVDDPCEVHKTLSPKCSYVITMLARLQLSTISIINEASTNVDSYRCHTIVHTAACNTNYIEIPKRYASFATWSTENFPSVDNLVRAGFFYTGTKTIVTCFYCNGSLQNWGPKDNPTIEHARWFPHCAYAKQLCGTELYRKIQESKRAQQERAKTNDSSNRSGVGPGNISDGRLLIPDENTLSRFVAARLDLPISQRLLDGNFKLSIIKRCWEDQLRLKREDFVSDCDVFMACTILRKQIEHIDGKKENIIVPSVAMKRIRESDQASSLPRNGTNIDDSLNDTAQARAHEQVISESSSTSSSDSNDVDVTGLSESGTNEMSGTASASAGKEMKNSNPSLLKNAARSHEDTSSPANPCVLCLEEEKRLACMPCGHLATCVPCGHSLRSCPICRRGIDAFIRIYL